jgi:4'-phosphopantetheinyl transferase
MRLDGETRLFTGLPDNVEARRDALDRLLAEDLGPAETDRTIFRDQSGKPHLTGRRDYWFNISHCEGMLLVARSRRGAVGADLETLARCRMAWEDASRSFAPAERRLLKALPPALAPLAFTFLWTGKEAVLKARGTGITGGLAEPDFSQLPELAAPPPWSRANVKLDDERFAVTWYMVAVDEAVTVAARADALSNPGTS